MNYIYFLPCFRSDCNDIVKKFSCLVCTKKGGVINKEGNKTAYEAMLSY